MSTAMTQDKPTFVAPLSVPVPLRNGEVLISSADMGRLLAAKTLLLPVMQTLLEHAPTLLDEERLRRIKAARALETEDITDLCLLLEEADVLIDLVAALAPMPRDQVLLLMPDECVYLAAVVVQVNWDFFAQALPVLKAAAQRLPGLGTTRLPSAVTG